MQGANRVFFNTITQYSRTIFSLLISLFTTRLILEVLGVENFGIYALVGGIIAMLSFIRSSLASTTQRFLSFYQGKRDIVMQHKIFNNTVSIQLLISIILVLFLLIIKPFLFDGFLNIPEARIESAKVVYNCMIFTVFITMQSTPYYATLIAHENILYTSIIQLLEALLKIPIALSLAVSPIDSLVFYSVLIMSVQILSFLAYRIYCKNKYEETTATKLFSLDKKVFFEMFSFAGWVIYSTGCVIGRTQGIAILLNKFYGASINAAYGIAWQLTGQVSFLSSSLMTAINPQIMRAEGENNRLKMLRYSEIASKFSFLFLSAICIPAILEMETILSIWLNNIPDYTILFCQFVLLTNLADQLTIGLVTANKAIGNIKLYSLTINSIKLLTVPSALVFLLLDFPPISVMICLLFFEVICAISRIPFLKFTGGLSIRSFVRKVFLMEFLPVTITLCCTYFYSIKFDSPLSFIGSFIISTVILTSTSYFFGLCDDEKIIINKILNSIIKKK